MYSLLLTQLAVVQMGNDVPRSLHALSSAESIRDRQSLLETCRSKRSAD